MVLAFGIGGWRGGLGIGLVLAIRIGNWNWGLEFGIGH